MKIPPAYSPPDYQSADVTAIQLLEKGECPPELQQRALTWIINNVCATHDQSYRPDTHETAFHEGRRFCGNAILKMLKLDPKKVADMDKRRKQ